MCGISGFIGESGQRPRVLSDMVTAIRHRGPDDEGFLTINPRSGALQLQGGPDTPPSVYQAEDVPYSPTGSILGSDETPVKVGLGHRRLSILDLSEAGHQPLSSPDGRYWIVYNGEVYNYRELRKELESLGHTFYSGTDTEVILAAYAEWGRECLHRFNGMWAFAILDRNKGEVFFSRDRFGIKPLYYWISPDGMFCFSSEIKSFSAYPGWKSQVNPNRTYDFLLNGFLDHTDETMFEGVFHVPPGHCATVPINRIYSKSGSRIETQPWYRIKENEFNGSFEEASLRFRELFFDSVGLRLRADVEVGSCLSGGLDSSSIVCAMNRILEDRQASTCQKTFSSCSDIGRFDEREYIEEVTRFTEVDAHFVYPSGNRLFTELSKLVWHQDEPFGTSSIYAQWNVFRLAGENQVKVMLDGQGGDEILAGYHSFFAPHIAGLFRKLRWIRMYDEIQYLKRLHGYRGSARDIVLGLIPDSLERLIKKRAQPYTDLFDAGKLSGRMHPYVFENGNQHRRDITELSRLQLQQSVIPRLLHWEDRNSMAHSIEARVPMLDYRLVEFMLGLPDDFKIQRGMTKRVLRSGMDGLIPDRIRDRMGKLGFETPEEVWVKRLSTDLFRDKLRRAVEQSGHLIRAEAIDYFDEVVDGNKSYDPVIWRMICFGVWCERFEISLK